MEKYRMRPIQSGKTTRMSYATKQEVLDMPNLIGVQVDSYKWFLDEGLDEAFKDISPITDFSGKLSLEFVDYNLFEEDKKYTIEECKERDATYSAPLKVNVRLINNETGEINQHEVFMGDMPLMTETGTFVINGAERVIVSQLVRSPGIYYTIGRDKTGKTLYSCQVIPNRGAWLEYETDANDVFYVKVDRNRKVPVTVLIRSLGIGTDEEILELFGDEPKLRASFEKDPSKSYEDGILELYKRLRPGEPLAVESAESLINAMFFDQRRYDLARVGRFKFNKKLAFENRIVNLILAEDVVDPLTGEVLYAQGEIITKEASRNIQNAAVDHVIVQTETENVKVLSNMMVDIDQWIEDRLPGVDPEDLGITEMVYYPVLAQLLDEYDDAEELQEAIKNSITELIPKHITKEDILASINYNMHLEYEVGSDDDIDHLGNRRIKSVGELLQNQYRIGLSRLERVVRERMQTQDIETLTPQSLINIKPVTAAVKEFFGSSQLSQFMDQNNPLSELTHKRRLSALGPGGLSRERAGFEVRDVHYTHYGRMCPIETPEGPNIGLINSLATFARINKYGFIEAPYRRVDKTDPLNPVVTDEVVYMTADEEDQYIVAQASEPLDEENHFVNKNVAGRFRDEISVYPKRKVDFMDVSPRMVFSVATSMVPFLQNDDANRALMGSNMQRQAVPLLKTDAPIVGTGIEAKAARDSGVTIIAKRDGLVTYSSSEKIIIKADEDGTDDIYHVIKFSRSNQGNCMNQRPIVFKGDKVKAGEVIADGASTSNGELALGKNPLIGFMTWEGYNYEDAVLLSERLVKDDVYTSVHIEEYESDARDTKLGPEEITRDLSGLSSDALKNLDEQGIVRIGAEVRAGDILVGKVTPKGETELTAEEKLLRAIFGEKAREVRDTSLRVPHGAYGVVMDVKIFTRENGDELPPGVTKSVRVYIAQKRKISVGDKMAGRHGNKGVVSRVLPVEDMPFLPNGRPLDIVLNPLGVPSRMNIGQVLELHLGLASEVLGFKVSTPIFDGAKEEDITKELRMANDYVNTSWEEFEAKYKDYVDAGVMQYLYENRDHREEWKGVPIDETGKVQLRDGRTGEAIPAPVSIGFMHYLKLHHLVDDKIHARSTGPYSLVTQQPLGGKAQFGGQRFGEMEVWALEAYGASSTLQEILTVKSDDIYGRVKTYEAIIKGENIPDPGTPESFKVLLKEFQSLGLDVRVLDDTGSEVELGGIKDYDRDTKKLLEGDDSQRYEGDLEKGGYGEVDESGEYVEESSLKSEDDFDDSYDDDYDDGFNGSDDE
ncbi:MAG: DNA-directed RNA polymerase subunit beta [Eubacterium sp.]|nr:DNA-directed RNA polymerase subunit beta [Eubacterium sp.]